MDESRGIGICHMEFILLYIGVVITAIDERNILDILYAIFLTVYFIRICIYKKKNKNSLLNR